VDVVVSGRNVEVPDHFRVHVQDKLSRITRYDPKMIRIDVELSHEANRRQAKNRQRIQITVTGRGPTVRAEAAGESFYAALEVASDRLDRRLSRLHDRRLDRAGSRMAPTTVAVGRAGAVSEDISDSEWLPELDDTDADFHGADQRTSTSDGADSAHPDAPDWSAGDGPGRIVRIKDHPADPMTVDQALLRMELVGHDFYLFNDADSGRASVVYRRRGFDYGLLRLS
jgi:ribosomal subunit interface protein